MKTVRHLADFKRIEEKTITCGSRPPAFFADARADARKKRASATAFRYANTYGCGYFGRFRAFSLFTDTLFALDAFACSEAELLLSIKPSYRLSYKKAVARRNKCYAIFVNSLKTLFAQHSDYYLAYIIFSFYEPYCSLLSYLPNLASITRHSCQTRLELFTVKRLYKCVPNPKYLVDLISLLFAFLHSSQAHHLSIASGDAILIADKRKSHRIAFKRLFTYCRFSNSSQRTTLSLASFAYHFTLLLSKSAIT